MNKYVVAFIDFFSNDLKQELIEAENAREAVLESSFGLDFALEDEDSTFEECKQKAFDADCMFSVIKVS